MKHHSYPITRGSLETGKQAAINFPIDVVGGVIDLVNVGNSLLQSGEIEFGINGK